MASKRLLKKIIYVQVSLDGGAINVDESPFSKDALAEYGDRQFKYTRVEEVK